MAIDVNQKINMNLSQLSDAELSALYTEVNTETTILSFVYMVAYNARDVEVLVKLDNKFKFVALANQMSHENTVDFNAVLGTVKYVETGITNHAHNVLNRVVHDKRIGDHDRVEGAIVLTPKPGMYDWVFSCDINSLYPNVIRSLNISPEKIMGQFTQKEQAWSDIQNGAEARHCCIFESGEQLVFTASEWKGILAEHKWAVSAYGTVFDQGGDVGVVPDIITYWYTERKRLQAEKKKWHKEAVRLETIENPSADILAQLVQARANTEHYDMLQTTKKISLNSLYGSLLNVAFRFGDERMGASVTASGRQITLHMLAALNDIMGHGYVMPEKRVEVDNKGKIHNLYSFAGDTPCIYSDTDSAYVKIDGNPKQEEAIIIADTATVELNSTFKSFMQSAFSCRPGYDEYIVAGREIVARRMLLQAKKKYMAKVVDLEGFAVDKMKSMGSEIKKADTPKIIRSFLKTTVDMILAGEQYDDVAKFINTQRKTLLKDPNNVFALGVAKQVNNMDKFLIEYRTPGTLKNPDTGRTIAVPGHVRASLNYNDLLQIFEKGGKEIRSGDKVLIYQVKANQFGYDTVAIPAEMTKFPGWMIENFVIDVALTEQKMFDNKLSGIFSALGRDVPSPQSMLFQSLVQF